MVPADTTTGDEYRYLTFLYYDLVESTPMSQRLDEETWREFLGSFLRISNSVVLRHGGEIQDNHGDGALAFFGFPATQRISAVQAVRAGLELVNGTHTVFTELNANLRSSGLDPLQLRVGIHSGRVVIGTINGRRTATGFVLAFTERLHRCADPNTVVLGSATLELLGDRFQIERVGERKLKGVDKPALCFRALSENDDGPLLRSSYVGREHEIQCLQSEWQAIRSGDIPRVVLVTGEAGVGKTRLISEFRRSVDQENVTRLTWRCQPDMSDNAWHPVIAALNKRLSDPEIRALDSPIARLEAILPGALPREIAVPALAHMLDLPCEPEYVDTFSSSEARREAYFDLLVMAFVLESRQRQVLLIIEDAQWIDASTLEAVIRLSKRTDSGPCMLLLTQRTETSAVWTCPLATHKKLEIGRLSETAARALVASIPGCDMLDKSTVSRVLERSDGIPLFIEESVNLEVDRVQSNSAPVPDSNSLSTTSSAAVPPRLIDLLTERLDRVGDARETAGLAAAIGRQFPLELLEAVSTLPPDTLHQHIQRLVDTGLIHRRDSDAALIGRFKHALVRDSAYAILLESRRRFHHARIAEELHTNGMHGKPVSPDRLAFHYSAAGNNERAFEFWMAAGHQARRNSEQSEAISHFRRAENLIDALPSDKSSKRSRQALELHLASVRCHVVLDGYSSEESYRHAKCAETLALKYGTESQIVNARFGISSWLFVTGRIEEALHLAIDCLRRSDKALSQLDSDTDKQERDSYVLGVARASWACGNMEFHSGKFDLAMQRIDRCIDLCRSVSPLGKYMDQDPLVMCLCYKAWYEWETGDPDQAITTVAEAVTIARNNGRAFSIALALTFHSAICLFRGEITDAIKYATDSISISGKSHYATWHAWALVLRGRARCHESSERVVGIEEIIEGLRLWSISGATITRPFMLAQLAEAYCLDGQFDQAIGVIDKAQLIVDKHGDCYYEAAIVRIRGQILEQMSTDDEGLNLARDCYRHSLHLANQRKQFGSALRAAIVLCHLDKSSIDRTEAVQVLHNTLEKISSGFNTKDPHYARQILVDIKSSRLALEKGK